MADPVLPANVAAKKPSTDRSAPHDSRPAAVRVVIVSPVRLLGEGLVRWLRTEPTVVVLGTVQHFGGLRELLSDDAGAIVIVDVSGDIDLDEVRLFAAERPDVTMLALGLLEQRAAVVRCARAGFRGYIARDTALKDLVPLLNEAAGGGTRCSAEIATGLMQALFRPDLDLAPPQLAGPPITPREGEVLRLLGRGYSNKAIARELTVSAATVKNHVHSILAKFGACRRSEVARTVREQPWIAGPRLKASLKKPLLLLAISLCWA
jgi:two-component system nitrate/nitrite response regulator NarL